METICDLANSRMYRRHAPPHRQESLAACDDVINNTGLATSDSIGDAQVSELCSEISVSISTKPCSPVPPMECPVSTLALLKGHP